MTLPWLLDVTDGKEFVLVDAGWGAVPGLDYFLLGEHTLLAYESLIVPRCLQEGLKTNPYFIVDCRVVVRRLQLLLWRVCVIIDSDSRFKGMPKRLRLDGWLKSLTWSNGALRRFLLATFLCTVTPKMHDLLHPGLQAIDLVLLSELLLIGVLIMLSLMQRRYDCQVWFLGRRRGTTS
jgi:hypothetical protein